MADYFELLISNLSGTMPESTSYMPKELAYEQLKWLSGEDWGYDVKAWRSRRREIEKNMRALVDAFEAEETKGSRLKKLTNRRK